MLQSLQQSFVPVSRANQNSDTKPIAMTWIFMFSIRDRAESLCLHTICSLPILRSTLPAI